MKLSAITAISAFAVAISGCNDHRDSRPRATKTEVHGETSIFSAEEFDLASVIDLIQNNKVRNFEDLEKKINDPSNPMSNVDVDKDGVIDYVKIDDHPAENNEGLSVEFLALPSSKKDSLTKDDLVVIANVQVNKTAEGATISGGYPEYVRGHESHYYEPRVVHHTSGMGSFATGMMIGWMLSPRPMYTPIYGYPSYYRPVSRAGGSSFSSRRSTYRKTQKITRTTTRKPTNYKPSPSAKKSASTVKSLKGTGGGDYKRRANTTKKAATGWGGKSKTSTKSIPKTTSTSKKSSGTRSFGSNRRSSSRSFGGSSRGGGSFGLLTKGRIKIIRLTE